MWKFAILILRILILHVFFTSNAFVNSASVLLNSFVNWASNVAWVLLNTYKHHYNETFCTYLYLCQHIDIGLTMSYWYDLFLIFIFILIFILIIVICKISQIQMHLFFCLFLEYLLLFWDDNVNKECE